MKILSKLVPTGLAGRFALLLVVALLAANLVAAGLMIFERQRLDREAVQLREIERVVSLVPAIEAANPRSRRAIARNTTTRVSRVRVERSPIVETISTAPRSQALTQRLAEELPNREVRAAILRRPTREDPNVLAQVVAVSIRLSNADGAPVQWLNMVSRGNAPRLDGQAGRVFLLTLAASLVSVLAVGLIFVRRLTRPLGALAKAAHAAGQGDRSARAPETGAREMREAAHAFNAMQVEISQFDAERMRMLAAVGHDLRTPMTSLRIRAEMIDDPEQRDAMIRTLDEMGVMADGLVSYAREGHDGEASSNIALGPFLAQICEDRGANCTIETPVDVVARPVGLGRALGNLIDNALRYATSADVTLRAGARDAIITIEDDGPGIPQDQLEDMFQPFKRGDESRNVETGGAGLGLSIARTIIAAHGGQITLENRDTGGLRATIRLPLGPAQ